MLAAAVQKSLDAQHFIWHGDQVGSLLFEALWKAAERGVRVRLLLDDADTTGIDPTLATECTSALRRRIPAGLPIDWLL